MILGETSSHGRREEKERRCEEKLFAKRFLPMPLFQKLLDGWCMESAFVGVNGKRPYSRPGVGPG
jgi:hypothetical protein